MVRNVSFKCDENVEKIKLKMKYA